MKPVIWLCILVTSYFYCLPLGRFAFAGYQSDFRIFDFVIVVFWLVNWNYLSGRVQFILRSRKLCTHHAFMIGIIVVVSVIFTVIFRGENLAPAMIRVVRFLVYLSPLGACIAVSESREKCG